MKFSLQKGATYRASVVLGTFEGGISNDTLRDEITKVGFTNVHVTGKGYIRYITASWTREDQDRVLPRQVHEIIRVKSVEPMVLPGVPAVPPPPDVPAPEPKPKPAGKVIKGPVPWWKIW